MISVVLVWGSILAVHTLKFKVSILNLILFVAVIWDPSLNDNFKNSINYLFFFFKNLNNRHKLSIYGKFLLKLFFILLTIFKNIIWRVLFPCFCLIFLSFFFRFFVCFVFEKIFTCSFNLSPANLSSLIVLLHLLNIKWSKAKIFAVSIYKLNFPSCK